MTTTIHAVITVVCLHTRTLYFTRTLYTRVSLVIITTSIGVFSRRVRGNFPSPFGFLLDALVPRVLI